MTAEKIPTLKQIKDEFDARMAIHHTQMADYDAMVARGLEERILYATSLQTACKTVEQKRKRL